MWGVIAGTGFEHSPSVSSIGDLDRETPFGLASSGLKIVRAGEHEVAFLPRHGSHHELLPSEINFCANIYALKRAGVTQIVSVSAVGSLQEEFAPGDLVVPNQYIDRTKGVRRHTFTGEGMVAHVPLAEPASPALRLLMQEIASTVHCKVHIGGTYVCIEGPYFSTYVESLSYRALSASIIGMTNFPEFALAREAGIAYLPCCFVTDYDCWDQSRPHVTVEEVLLQMKKNNECAYDMIPKIFAALDGQKVRCETTQQHGIRSGLLTPMDHLTESQREILSILSTSLGE
jgi:5'-methylthioadenosine phosphorylase